MTHTSTPEKSELYDFTPTQEDLINSVKIIIFNPFIAIVQPSKVSYSGGKKEKKKIPQSGLSFVLSLCDFVNPGV